MTDNIPTERLRDCLELLKASCSPKEYSEIQEIRQQTGGLFNFLLKVQTPQRVIFFKQYLDGVPNDTYSLPEIPAEERVRLAYEVQKLAYSATEQLEPGLVPELISFDKRNNSFLMAEANGNYTLSEHLSRGDIPEILLKHLPLALSRLHRSTHNRYSEDSIYGNRKFRDFKLNLQYDGILPHISDDEALVVMQCKKRYQSQSECVTHGDINSRNIVVGPTTLGIIDFEQSHLGTGSYDIAYILSELLISAVQFGREDELTGIIRRFLDIYFDDQWLKDRTEFEFEITLHLAIQAIYRFVGPSHSAWTFYVDTDKADATIRMCRKILMNNIPVSEIDFTGLLSEALSEVPG